jgi:hypothetical protein
MIMIAEITERTTPVAFDGALATVPRDRVPRAAGRRLDPRSINPNSRIIVAPNPLDAIIGVGKVAGLKGGAKLLKLLWTLGVLLLCCASAP